MLAEHPVRTKFKFTLGVRLGMPLPCLVHGPQIVLEVGHEQVHLEQVEQLEPIAGRSLTRLGRLERGLVNLARVDGPLLFLLHLGYGQEKQAVHFEIRALVGRDAPLGGCGV